MMIMKKKLVDDNEEKIGLNCGSQFEMLHCEFYGFSYSNMLIYMIMGLFGTDRYPINFLLLVNGLLHT